MLLPRRSAPRWSVADRSFLLQHLDLSAEDGGQAAALRKIQQREADRFMPLWQQREQLKRDVKEFVTLQRIKVKDPHGEGIYHLSFSSLHGACISVHFEPFEWDSIPPDSRPADPVMYVYLPAPPEEQKYAWYPYNGCTDIRVQAQAVIAAIYAGRKLHNIQCGAQVR